LDKDLSKLWHYLTHEQVSALDVLVLSIVGSFFTWILAMVGKFLGRLLLKTIMSIYKYLFNMIVKSSREFHRRYITKKVTMNEYIIIKDKLEKGEKLKGYEERKYAIWIEKMDKLKAEGRFPVTADEFTNTLDKLKKQNETFKG